MTTKRHWIAMVLVLGGMLGQATAQVAPDDPRVTPAVLAYRKARPAVVSISSKKIVRAQFGLRGRDLFDKMFPRTFSRRVPVQSLGSGVLISPAGYIVTNSHVIRRAEKITVTLADNSQYEARAISADPSHDLAVLKIEPTGGQKLPFLPLGRSDDLMVGETVIAIGNPLGYSSSLTTGVISAIGRTLNFGDDVVIRGLIQTDAPINPGNSGGPLLNVKGEFVGINTAVRADAQNIGFAIPVDLLAEELDNLLDFESLNRVVFGAEIAQRHGPSGDELYVTEVRPGTPAAGKLRVGDRLVAMNDVPMRQITDYACAALAIGADDTLRLKLVRDGAEIVLSVTVLAKPRPDAAALALQRFGLKLRPVDKGLARDLGLWVNQGLLVVGIEPGSPAQKLGIKLKDVILKVGRLYVTDMETLGVLLEDVQPGQVVKIDLIRNNIRVMDVGIQAQ